MKRIRSHKEGSEIGDPENSKPPSHLPREEVPAALLEHWQVSDKLLSSMKVERIVRPQPYKFVHIDIDYVVSGLVHTFADAFEQALKRKQSKSLSKEDIADLKARAKDVMPGIVTRFLQLRLYNIAVAKEVTPEGFPSKPTKIDLTIQLPTPLARAISSIGVFGPSGVFPEIAYFPTFCRDPTLSQLVGSAAHCKVQGYAKLFPEFAKCGITTTTVETRDSDGTSWYLLGTEPEEDNSESHHIIASFPPQCGNISATDAVTRSYCVHYDSRYPYPDARHKVRKHLYVGEDSVGSNFGIALEWVYCRKQPSCFMQVDMATKPQNVANKLAQKRQFWP